MNRKTIQKGGIRFGVITVAAAALVALFASLGATVPASAAAVTYDVDGDTRYTYQTALGEADSTRYAGRVWTDKSVADADVTFHDPHGGNGDQTVTKGDSDFLVTYSALAASQTVTGGAAPADTVFILDLSASMTWGDGADETHEMPRESSRLQAMVDSVNAAIDRLARADGRNRVAIVTFNGGVDGTNLLDLTSGEEMLGSVGDSVYLEIGSWDSGSPDDPDDTSAVVTCRINGNTARTAGGTNIQAGLFHGMGVLADVGSTTVTVNGETVTRVPNVVLMSDGAPTTFSSAADARYRKYDGRKDACPDTYVTGTIDRGTAVCRAGDVPVYGGSWWDSSSHHEIGAGDNNNPDSADGFMALLTASYLKDRISRRYYGSADGERQANVYTVGFATAVQNREMAMMAGIVLDPAEYLGRAADFAGSENGDEDNRNSNNEQIRQVAEAVTAYLDGTDPVVLQGSIGDGGNDDQIMFEIPVDDRPAGYAPTALTYPTRAFAAEDDGQLADALGQIANLITESAKSPTETDGGNPAGSGYITYEDPIGEHMHVDGVKSLIWAGHRFDNASVADDAGSGCTTYTFHGGIDSPVYGRHDVSEIDIRSCTDRNAQTLTVRIPASAIPIRVTDVTLDAGGSPSKIGGNNALPLRLVYGVSLNGNVTADGVLDRATVSDYLSAGGDGAVHTNGDSAYFYANRYTGAADGKRTMGDATATFQPADDNPYYFFQRNTPLYLDEQCTVRAVDFEEHATYHLQISYYAMRDGAPILQTVTVPRTGASLNGEYVATDGEGLYVKAGAPRIGNLRDSVADKTGDDNRTGTASTVRYPTFAGDIADGSFVIHLGNNGRLGIPIPVIPAEGAIDVSKTIRGIASVDLGFSFDLTFDDRRDASIENQVTDAGQVAVGDGDIWTALPDDNTATITLDGRHVQGQTRTGTFNVRFLQPGTYVFTLAENRDDMPAGWTYDDTEHTIVVTVAERADQLRSLTVTGIAYNGSPDATVAEFTNGFSSVSSLPLTGSGLAARHVMLIGFGVMLLACAAWVLAHRHRV